MTFTYPVDGYVLILSLSPYMAGPQCSNALCHAPHVPLHDWPQDCRPHQRAQRHCQQAAWLRLLISLQHLDETPLEKKRAVVLSACYTWKDEGKQEDETEQFP